RVVPKLERLSFYISKKTKTPTKKVTQTETIWAILVNSSTPIKCKDIPFLRSMSREVCIILLNIRHY
ncbi:MAG: hypothetical protein RLZZ306_1270, partial [Bacteroidota bacterium]